MLDETPVPPYIDAMNDPAFDDEFLWLEDIEGTEATAWVAAQNSRTEALLRDAQFETDRKIFLDIFNADDRIPRIVQRGAFLYNFWTDEAHRRGIWRRTTLESYRTAQPVWDTLLDLDALGASEAESWVWAGSSWLPGHHQTVLIALSRGGADATVIREFDLATLQFLADGFYIPEAKTSVSWVDPDTLLVTSADGGDVTSSGYARTIRRWSRGTILAETPVIFEIDQADIYTYAAIDHDPTHGHILFARALSFFTTEYSYESATQPRITLDLPADCIIEISHGRLLVTPRRDYQTSGTIWPAGSLLCIDMANFLAGARNFVALFTPGDRTSLDSWLNFPDHLIVTILDNVSSRALFFRPDGSKATPLAGMPETSSISVQKLAPDDHTETSYLISISSFLEPDRILLGHGDNQAEPLKSARPLFDAAHLQVWQYHATAKDGTAIPYFWIGPRAAPPAGGRPTHLYGYGGFEVSLQPHYLGPTGAVWLARGGAYVIANIRGGGEFGPAWHQAGIRQGKRVAQDDFAAVAIDLATRGLAEPARILAEGGSNGGLLVGNMLTRHPDAFGAIICTVPLLDMRRYTQLLAGRSWVAEYGDPDLPADWDYLQHYSPYHIAKPGQNYPPSLFMTTRRDDRVHPGHARKMAAKMQAMKYDALYYEQLEGGHGSGADSTQRAFLAALFEAFHRRTLQCG